MSECTTWYKAEASVARHDGPRRQRLVDRCLEVFVEAGTLDLSLDALAAGAGISKRMLVHYFGGRGAIEEKAMARLEERLRERFSPGSFPAGTPPRKVVMALWEQTTSKVSRGVLLLVMDLSKRAWSGSARAKHFYEEQRRLWTELLLKFLPDRVLVEDVLQLFQGAVLTFLITGDPQPGKRALLRLISRTDEKTSKRAPIRERRSLSGVTRA